MKFVIHADWGSYSIPKTVKEKFDEFNVKYDESIFNPDGSFEVRTNNFFIEYVEQSHDPYYKIVNVPDNFTDYTIFDYDGKETLIYVVDGKIYEA